MRSGTPPLRTHWSNLVAPLVSLVVVVTIVLSIIAVVHGASRTIPTSGATSKSTGNASGASHATNALPLAPDFTLLTLTGGAFHLASQRGHVVVLYFMSTICAACVRGSYFVATSMQDANRPTAEALAIDMNPGDTANDVKSFEQSASIPANAPLTWAFDENQQVASHYGVLALGTVFVVDAQGRIVYESDGAVAPGQLVQVVQSHA
ncbi:MAG TPA: TlpA disulfide reductase family protein [Ktedonobacterales bacterium]|nr:TlpA disulfide reductase family protein [Ktedonobacterales bacterium]